MYGYHEGYLVTPVSTGAIVTGHMLAGTLVAGLAGSFVLLAIMLFTPLPMTTPEALGGGLLTVFLTALAITGLWFLLFARALSGFARSARVVIEQDRPDDGFYVAANALPIVVESLSNAINVARTRVACDQALD